MVYQATIHICMNRKLFLSVYWSELIVCKANTRGRQPPTSGCDLAHKHAPRWLLFNVTYYLCRTWRYTRGFSKDMIQKRRDKSVCLMQIAALFARSAESKHVHSIHAGQGCAPQTHPDLTTSARTAVFEVFA